MSSGEQLREKVENFPWADYFLASKVLVVGVTDDNSVVAACGLRSIFNIRVTYVKEAYRGHGLGKKLRNLTTDVARGRGLHFTILCVFYPYEERPHAHSVNPKSGHREVARLRDPKIIIFMLPLAFVGEIAYYFLRIVFPRLPNVFLAHIAQATHDRTRIRR